MPLTTTGSLIYGSDYNAIQVLVTQVLGSGSPFGPGTGSPNYGYNQPLASGLVSAGALITAPQWNALISDVNTCWVHQTNGNFPGYATVAQGTLITASMNNNLFNAMNTALANRMTVSPSQLATTVAGTTQYNTSWGGGSSGISNTGSITWSSSANLQYFFNQGGSIRFGGFGPALSGFIQDSYWQSALSSFSYTINYTEFTALTGSPALRYNQFGQPSPYASNYIQVSAWVTGGATINYTVSYYDQHTGSGGGPDFVSAGAGLNLFVSRATGAFSGTNFSSVNVPAGWSTF